MNLYMQQRVFTWGDKFNVFDQAGNIKYIVEGEIFSWGKKLHLYDLAGNELAFIQQKVFSFLPRYYITRPGYGEIEVVKEFTFFRAEYSVIGPNWKVYGDFWDHEYGVTDNGRSVVEVSKEWLTWGDTYRINISSDVDEIIALSVVLVIDACIEAQQNN